MAREPKEQEDGLNQEEYEAWVRSWSEEEVAEALDRADHEWDDEADEADEYDEDTFFDD